MNKEYKIKLDLNKKLYNKKMAFNQFDENVNDFYIEVTKNNELVKDLDKSIVTLVAIKPNNTVDAQFIEVKEGQIYADLKPSMCDLVGNYQAKAMIVLEGEIVTTDTINYSVNEDKIISRLNEDAVSDERFTLFTDALARLSAIEISEEQRQINEAERILAEENRKIEEAKRVEAELIRQHEEADRTKYDAIRESNENIRKINEEARISSENVRLENEANRIEQEANRVKAEQLRKDNYNFMTEDEERRRSEANAHKEAEALRVQAETNRVNEEAKRRTIEQVRVSAENTRVSNENTRKANEVTRQTNETQRVEAETQRQSRYNSFILDAEANANNFENYTNNAKVKEEERKANELDRKSQEVQRISNENERISNENTRKANEVTRIESEKQRADAENLRKEKIIEIQSDYDSLKKVIIDENASANLQNQINQTNSQLEHNTNYLDNKKLDKNGVVTMANMGQDIKEAMTGGSVAVIGKNTVLEANIVDKQVTPTKTSFCEEISSPTISYELFETLKTWEKGSMYHLDTGVITSTQYTTNYIYSEKIDCAEETEYKVVSTTINNGQVLFWNDDEYLGFNYLTETGNTFTTLSNSNKMAFNVGDYNYPYEEVHIKRYDYSNVDISIPKLKISKDNIEKDVLNTCIDGDVFIKYPYLTSDDNLNDILKSGRYFSIEAQNQPTSGSYHLDVREYKTVYTNPAFITQTLTKFKSGDMYIRTIYNNNFTEWKKVLFDTNSTRKIVNFGDSIFGNTNNNTSISSYMSEILGVDCFNAGFGGCRMAQRSELHWNAFSMSSIAYSIANNNWTLQDSHIDNTSLPSYFKGKLTQLKEINFNEVDLITIAYGTNDYYSTLEMDNEFDKYDKNTFLGALRYSVKTILEKYPHLKILVISPIWRGFVDEEYDSDTKDFGTGTLVDYYIAMEKTCKELKIPFLNSYCESGINAITKDYFFNSDDYVHPIDIGRKRYAELIAGKIKTL